MQCPRCGFDHTFQTCPNCGLRSDTPAPPPLPPDYPPPHQHASATPERRGLPWDRRAELGTIPAGIETIKGVLLSPASTFREMRLSGDIGSPFLFALVLGSLGGWIAMGWQRLVESMGVGSQNPWGQLGAAEGVGFACGALIGVPVGLSVGLFIGSGIIHLCLMLFGGARNGFEATFRTYAYATGSTAPLAIIPVCGQVIGYIWGIVAAIIGLKQAHETDTWRAACAVLLPVVLCCACLVALFAVFGAALLAAAGQAAGGQ